MVSSLELLPFCSPALLLGLTHVLLFFQTKNYHNVEYRRNFRGHSHKVEDLHEINLLGIKEKALRELRGEMACG